MTDDARMLSCPIKFWCLFWGNDSAYKFRKQGVETEWFLSFYTVFSIGCDFVSSSRTQRHLVMSAAIFYFHDSEGATGVSGRGQGCCKHSTKLSTGLITEKKSTMSTVFRLINPALHLTIFTECVIPINATLGSTKSS